MAESQQFLIFTTEQVKPFSNVLFLIVCVTSQAYACVAAKMSSLCDVFMF